VTRDSPAGGDLTETLVISQVTFECGIAWRLLCISSAVLDLVAQALLALLAPRLEQGVDLGQVVLLQGHRGDIVRYRAISVAQSSNRASRAAISAAISEGSGKAPGRRRSLTSAPTRRGLSSWSPAPSPELRVSAWAAAREFSFHGGSEGSQGKCGCLWPCGARHVVVVTEEADVLDGLVVAQCLHDLVGAGDGDVLTRLLVPPPQFLT